MPLDNTIDPNADIKLVNFDGTVGTVKGKDVADYTQSPGSPWKVATPEDSALYDRHILRGSTSQKLQGVVEQAINFPFFGLPTKVISAIPGMEGYQKSVEEREAELNPIVNLAAKGAGAIIDPLGTIGALESTAGKVAAPIVEKAGTHALGRILGAGAKAGIAGTMYGAAENIGSQSFDSQPWSSDAFIDHALSTGEQWGMFGAGLKTAGEGFSLLRNIKDTSLKNLNKVVAKGTGESVLAPEISPIDIIDLNRKMSPLGKKATEFKINTDPTNPENPINSYTHLNENKSVTIKPEQLVGNGADFNTQQGLQKIGSDLGIDDFDTKYKFLKNPNEDIVKFTKRMAMDQSSIDWLSKNSSFLTPEEMLSFKQSQDALNQIKNIENPSEQIRSEGQKAINNINNLAIDASERPDVPKEELQFLDSKPKAASEAVGKYFDNLDYAKIDNNIHVFNPEAVTGELNRLTEPKKFTPVGEQVKSELGIKEKAIEKRPVSTFNEVAKYIKDNLYPENGEMDGSKHAIDHIYDKNEELLNRSSDEYKSAIDGAINRLEMAKMPIDITHLDIAKYIENYILDQFRDPLTGNARSVYKKAFDEIKAYADGFKENGFIQTKFGKEYQKIPMDELRNIRMGIDQNEAQWGKDKVGVTSQAARDLRGYLEDETIKTLKKLDPNEATAKRYVNAKNMVHMGLTAREIIGSSTGKAVESHAASGKAMSAILGGDIGSFIGKSTKIPYAGRVGRVIGTALGSGSEAMGALSRYSDSLRESVYKTIGEGLNSYHSQIERAARGIVHSDKVEYPMAKRIGTQNYAAIKKDEQKIKHQEQNQEKNISDFFDRNSALSDMAPNTITKSVSTLVKGKMFLMSKIPQNPYAGKPWRESKWEPNQADIDKYFRYKEAVEKPSLILKQLQNGYATPEAIEVLNTVYPDTKNALMTQVVNSLNAKKDIPQDKRVLLFKVFGMPLDNFSSGRLFAEMQGNAAGLIQQEQAQAQQGFNPQNKPLNTSKISDPMASLTTGTRSLSTQD